MLLFCALATPLGNTTRPAMTSPRCIADPLLMHPELIATHTLQHSGMPSHSIPCLLFLKYSAFHFFLRNSVSARPHLCPPQATPRRASIQVTTPLRPSPARLAVMRARAPFWHFECCSIHSQGNGLMVASKPLGSTPVLPAIGPQSTPTPKSRQPESALSPQGSRALSSRPLGQLPLRYRGPVSPAVFVLNLCVILRPVFKFSFLCFF
jgi:hypothetical protein